MKRLVRFSLLGLLVFGVVLIVGGAVMWVQPVPEDTIENWITPSSRIPGNGLMMTWGVGGGPMGEPDAWHFHVVFCANSTANIVLLWNLNETTLFEKSSNKLDESFTVALPRTTHSWRWDWAIMNPGDSVLRVENFTVTHYAIRYPERSVGSMALGTGLIAVVAVPILKIHFRRRDILPI